MKGTDKQVTWAQDNMNYLETIEFLMDEYGMTEENACRIADMEFNPDYNADDYDF